MRPAPLFLFTLALTAPAGVVGMSAAHEQHATMMPVLDHEDRIVRRELFAGDGGAGRVWVRAVRDLVEDRLDVDALPGDAPVTVWTLGGDVIAFDVDGKFAARALDAGGERWVFDDGTTLDGPALARPVRYLAVASRLGVREHPITHRITWHAGTDYAAVVGTPVHAFKDGVVTKWARSWTAGRMLMIRHDDGSETRYFHLDAKADGIEEHARVHQGQLVAYVGKTGRVTGAHLHFELRDRFGTPIDPVVARYAGASRIDGPALAALRLRRDLLRTYLADGTRDYQSPLTQPPSELERTVDDDGEAMPVAPVVPLRRGEPRAQARSFRPVFFRRGRPSA